MSCEKFIDNFFHMLDFTVAIPLLISMCALFCVYVLIEIALVYHAEAESEFNRTQNSRENGLARGTSTLNSRENVSACETSTNHHGPI